MLHGNQKRVTKLPDTDAATFAVFSQWLYRGDKCNTGEILQHTVARANNRLPNTGAQERAEHSNENTNSSASASASDYYDFDMQLKCYALSERLQAPDFQRLIIKEIRQHGDLCDPADLMADLVEYAYSNTDREKDPLRQFCVKMKCVRISIEEARADEKFRPLLDMGGALAKNTKQALRKQAMDQAKTLDEMEED